MKWYGYVTIAIAWTPALGGVPIWVAWPVAFVFWHVMEARRKYA